MSSFISSLSLSVLSTSSCFPFYDSLPEDMQFLVREYLHLEQIRHHIVYIKYYNLCPLAMSKFSLQQINEHFHNDDYFSMSVYKPWAINTYISYNLSNINKYSYSRKYVDDLSYENLRKIILCSKMKMASRNSLA